jgi:hypothetical protein
MERPMSAAPTDVVANFLAHTSPDQVDDAVGQGLAEEGRAMRAVRIHAKAGPDALVVEEAPYPHTAENDVVVRVHAAGFTPGELDWPSTWKDRAGGTAAQ